ncbi:MAG: hypothetical protein ACK5HT_20520, partial [Draconibacterium sp.]
MKTRIFITVVLLLLVIGGASSQNAGTPAASDEPVKIFATPETHGLVDSWITEYRKSNAGFNCELSSVELAEISSKVSDEGSLGFVMQQPGTSMSAESMWLMTLGREVIVAVYNEANPSVSSISENGFSAKELASMVDSKTSPEGEPVNLYVLDDTEVKLSVPKFLETDPAKIAGQKALPKEEFLAAIQKDKHAVGFCSLSTVLNTAEQAFAEKIKLLPIDRNGNGRLDYNENFYANPEQFERSVWIGKYPRTLVHSIYAVAPAFPENSELSDFLCWVTTSGQTAVGKNGYTELVYGEMQSNLEKLVPPVLLAEAQINESTRSSVFLWTVLVVAALA